MLKRFAQKTTSWLFSTGATLSIGILSFVGMLAITPSLLWCSLAFILAVAYEGQVNIEGISSALRRLFDKTYLKRSLAAEELDEQIKQKIGPELLNAYKTQQSAIAALERIHHPSPQEQQLLAQAKEQLLQLDRQIEARINNRFLNEYRKQKTYFKKLKKNHHLHTHDKLNLARVKERLFQMETFFLNHLNNLSSNTNLIEQELNQAIPLANRNQLLEKINFRLKLTRASWLFTIAAGISCGIATYSAFVTGIAATATVTSSSAIVTTLITALNIIPGGVLISLSVLAAFGYTLLLYQNVADMVQEYNEKTGTYFRRRQNNTGEKENLGIYMLRCLGGGLVLALATFGTIATAGTWWYAAKSINTSRLGKTIINVFQHIGYWLMLVPTFFFEAYNSLKTLDRIGQIITNKTGQISKSIYDTWQQENQGWFGFLRFLNPLRFIEKMLHHTGEALFFIGHLISMGVMSDRVGSVPPVLSATLNAAGEGLTDFNYLPDEDHGHDHNSNLLVFLKWTISIPVFCFKFLAALWDWPFSGSFKQSQQKMSLEWPFAKHHHHHHHHSERTDVTPDVDLEWKKQAINTTCHQEMQRLHASPAKTAAIEAIQQKVIANPHLSKADLEQEIAPQKAILSQHRSSFFYAGKTTSEETIDKMLDVYCRPAIGVR